MPSKRPPPIKHPPYNNNYAPPIEIWHNATIQGGVCEFKEKITYRQVPGDKRGAITDFSPAARLRMMKHFHRIDYTNLPKPIFMTLTYPDDRATPELPERNLHRQHMARRLEAATGKPIMCAWRIEWKMRLSGKLTDHVCPHWHWLILGHRFIDKDLVNRLWKKTIDWTDYCRTETKAVDNSQVIPMYMAKYISKDCVPLSLVNDAYHTKLGRQFGWLRKDEIPLCPKHHYRRLSKAQVDALMSLADETLPWYDERFGRSFTTLGEVSQDFLRIINGEVLDGT